MSVVNKLKEAEDKVERISVWCHPKAAKICNNETEAVISGPRLTEKGSLLFWHSVYVEGFPDGSAGEETACNVGDTSLIPKLGRSAREGNGNPLQYSCLENSMDRGAWQATVLGVTKSQTGLSSTSTRSMHIYTHTHTHTPTIDRLHHCVFRHQT